MPECKMVSRKERRSALVLNSKITLVRVVHLKELVMTVMTMEWNILILEYSLILLGL